MNNEIVISNINPQEILINEGGEAYGVTNVYVNGVDVTVGNIAYVVVPTKVSELINDKGYITQEQDPTVPYYVKQISLSNINSWNNKQSELVSGVNIKTINSNSILGSGNLDISTSYTAGTGIEITDENVINNTITDYEDLNNLPTIPTATSDLLNDSGYVTSSELSNVAFSGSYLDLSNTPDLSIYAQLDTEELINYYTKEYLFGLLPKVSDTGTNINLSNVYSSQLKLELGSTELSQAGTPTPDNPQDVHTISGSNKVKVEGRNIWKPFENGSITGTTESITNIATIKQRFNYTRTLTFSDGEITGFPTIGNGSYYIWTLKFSNLKPNTTYCFGGDYEYTNLTGATGNLITMNQIIPAPSEQTSLSGKAFQKFTTDANGESINYTNFINIDMNCCNDNTFMRIYNIQLVEGDYTSSTIPDYEPYISQEADINLSSKNLFNPYKVKAENSATLIITPTGFDITRTHGSGYGDEFIASYTIENLKANTIYTFNFDVKTELNIGNDSIYVYSDNLFGTALTKSNYASSGNNHKWNITTSSNGKMVIGFYGTTSAQNKIIKLTNVQLEEGSTKTNYMEYYDYGEYCKIGNYEDRIFKNISGDTDYSNTREEGAWYIKKNIGKVVLDGTETITADPLQSGLSYYSFNVRPSMTALPSSVCLCNKLLYSSSSIFTNDIQGIKPTSIGTFKIKIFDSSLTTTTLFANWLSNNNLLVYYILPTPTYTQITDETLIEQLESLKDLTSYSPQTNISQINADLPFTITATTLKDISNL